MRLIKVKYKNILHDFEIENFNTIEILKNEIKKKLKIPIIQQRLFTLNNQKKIILKNSDQINIIEKNSEGDTIINLKNLGPQILYKNLFYLEYIGPIIIFIIYLIIFKEKINSYYILISILVFFHYIKRLLETKFVHIFSTASVPYSNAWRNIIFYWVLFGIFVGLELFYIRDMNLSENSIREIIFTVFFFIFEILNFYCHWQLRKLRYDYFDGKVIFSKERKIPYGLFFDSVISPNYTFEILSWVCFIFISFSFFAIVFILIGASIMFIWAKGKKLKLLKNKKFTEYEKDIVKKRNLLVKYII